MTIYSAKMMDSMDSTELKEVYTKFAKSFAKEGIGSIDSFYANAEYNEESGIVTVWTKDDRKDFFRKNADGEWQYAGSKF